MTQETAWLDYTKPPPSNYRCGFCYAGDATSDERAGCIVVHWRCRFKNRTEARAAAWAWHDRRHAIVLDIDEQTCSGGKHMGAWMTAALAWTDAECAEVEAYAALPFPRGIDMPQALQRVLLPQGAT